MITRSGLEFRMQHRWERYPLLHFLRTLTRKLRKDYELSHTGKEPSFDDIWFDIDVDKLFAWIIIKNPDEKFNENYFNNLPEVIDTNLINDAGELIA